MPAGRETIKIIGAQGLVRREHGSPRRAISDTKRMMAERG